MVVVVAGRGGWGQVLVFSQFTSMLDVLGDFMQYRQVRENEWAGGGGREGGREIERDRETET